MNWIKQFNQTSKEIEKLVYDESIKVIIRVEDYYKLAYENLSEVTAISTSNNINISNMKDNVFKVMTYTSIIEDLLLYINEVNMGFITHILKVFSKCIKMFTIELYASVNNNKEKILCKKRLQLWLVKMQNQMMDLANFLDEGLSQEFFDNSEELCITIGEYLSKQFLEKITANKKHQEINYDNNKILNIYDWKAMEELALTNNYKYKYCNGSHRIYEHATTNKIIVIPSHDLGKGLSIKIQKQIYLNSSKIN